MAFPQTPVLDAFNRSENPLSTNWTNILNSIQANGSAALGNNASYSVAVYGTDYIGAQEVWCEITTKGATGHELSLGLMSKDSNNIATIDGYSIHWTVAAGTDTWSINRVDNGATTILASGSEELANGDIVGLRMLADGTLAAFRNGSQLGMASDTTYTGTGRLSLTIENTTWRINAFGGGLVHILDVNQGNESDAAQGTSRTKRKATGQTTETNISQAVTAQRVHALGQTAETDIAQILAARKMAAVSQSTEADSAHAIGAQKVLAVGQVAEIDAAQPSTYREPLTIGQSIEVDAAQPLTIRKVVSVLRAEETNTGQALAVRRIVPIGPAVEDDLAQSIAREKRVLLLPASQTDAAHAISTVGVLLIQPVEETDLAQSLFPRKRLAIVQPVDVELAQAMATRKRKSMALVSELDLAQALDSKVGLGRSAQVYVTERSLDFQTDSRRPDETQTRKVHPL